MEVSEKNTGTCPCASQEMSHPPVAFGSLHPPGWEECETPSQSPWTQELVSSMEDPLWEHPQPSPWSSEIHERSLAVNQREDERQKGFLFKS